MPKKLVKFEAAVSPRLLHVSKRRVLSFIKYIHYSIQKDSCQQTIAFLLDYRLDNIVWAIFDIINS